MMRWSTITDSLWGRKAKFSYLLSASFLLLFTYLGAKEIWTQEHRWAEIVSEMFLRGDFLHPYLDENDYYDKPLLSYWLISFFSYLTGTLTNLELRLPSAFSGLLAIYSIYYLGATLRDKQLGLLAGWLLLTTFYFVFWARVSSADMLNLAGSLFAIAWYYRKKDNATFFDYLIFFVVLALTSLCKGLIGAVIAIIAISPNLFTPLNFKKHLRFSLLFALLLGMLLYALPFLASSYFNVPSYPQNGLYLVYKENILRYFKPFDHQGPIYTYLIYLPIYLLPWAVLLFPALYSLPKRYPTMSDNSKWIVHAFGLLFLFFTLSGSRRSYYVLPLVPFAILFIADWFLTSVVTKKNDQKMTFSIVGFFILLLLIIDLLPAWYYSNYGVSKFVQVLQQEVSQVKPWKDWNIVMLDAESKLNFYLDSPLKIKHYDLKGNERKNVSTERLVKVWPILQNKPNTTIFISRKRYQVLLTPSFNNYKIISLNPPTWLPFFVRHDMNSPIAFVPNVL